MSDHDGNYRNHLDQLDFRHHTRSGLGLSGVLVWSGSFVLTRFGFKTALTPFDIIALRFGVAGLVLLPVVLMKGFGFRKLGPLGFVLLVSGAGVPYALLTTCGLQYAPASHAAALIPG